MSEDVVFRRSGTRPVEENRVDVVVANRWILATGGHPQRPKEHRNKCRDLFNGVFLAFDQTEHDRIPFAHALGVIRSDVEFDDLLPPTTAQPTAEEALNLMSRDTRNTFDTSRSCAPSTGARHLLVCCHGRTQTIMAAENDKNDFSNNKTIQVIKIINYLSLDPG